MIFTRHHKKTEIAQNIGAMIVLSVFAASCAAPNPNHVTVTHMGAKAYGDVTTIAVRTGDTVYLLSERLGVDMRALIDSNNLVPPYEVTAGQRLKVPAPPMVTVREGDTLATIARSYNADKSELVRLNNLQPPYQVAYGQQIKLPSVPVSSSAIVSSSVKDAAPVLVDEPTFEMGAISNAPQSDIRQEELASIQTHTPPATNTGLGGTTSSFPTVPTLPPADNLPGPGALTAPISTATIPTTPAAPVQTASVAPTKTTPQAVGAAPRFSWPVNGSILSDYGPKKGGRHNDGLNIGAPMGTPVRAAAAGEVVYTGDKVAGFGNLILIRHSGGYASAYAHVQNPLIKRGQQVAAGQAIASVGKTGNVSSPQVHFEIRKGTQAVNPKPYLP